MRTRWGFGWGRGGGREAHGGGLHSQLMVGHPVLGTGGQRHQVGVSSKGYEVEGKGGVGEGRGE